MNLFGNILIGIFFLITVLILLAIDIIGKSFKLKEESIYTLKIFNIFTILFLTIRFLDFNHFIVIPSDKFYHWEIKSDISLYIGSGLGLLFFDYVLIKGGTFESIYSDNLSDESRLFSKKRDFFEKVLELLQFNIDNELKKSLEEGNIEDVNNLVAKKITSFNKLIETIKGNDLNSLRGTDISTIKDFYESTNRRIMKEIFRLDYSSKRNMLIGILVSILAISILIYTAFEHKIELMEIIPRATVSLLIEAFAFFFFNQYRKQQEEIKYWNNEKTHLDIKIFAFSIAIDNKEIGTSDYMKTLISDLINTEKGQKNSDEKQKDNIVDKSKDKDEDKKLIIDILDKTKEIANLVTKK